MNDKSQEVRDIVLGDSKGTIYSHAIFCQCILPVRSLPTNTRHYEVRHGNASLMFTAGCFREEGTGEIHNQQVPAGAKARLLFTYIIDQAKRNDSPTIDMGNNLYQFMKKNGIPVCGSNANEIVKQVRNIAAADISLGISGETATHKYHSSDQFKIAKKVSFWMNKGNVEQPQLWEPYLTLSDDFMSALEVNSILLKLDPLIELQNNPRAMDMYMWLSYRIPQLKRKIKISLEDLHHIFGGSVRSYRHFNENFKKALKLASPHVSNAFVDFESDKKHLILGNNKHQIFVPSGQTNQIRKDKEPVIEGVFGELSQIGVARSKIKKLAEVEQEENIRKALDVTKQSMKKGKVKNPAGFFSKALEEGWAANEEIDFKSKEESSELIEMDLAYEKTISDIDWRKVRSQFAQMKGIPTFKNWIKDLTIVSRGNHKVTLKAKSRFISEYIEKNYLKDLINLWSQQDSNINDIDVIY